MSGLDTIIITADKLRRQTLEISRWCPFIILAMCNWRTNVHIPHISRESKQSVLGKERYFATGYVCEISRKNHAYSQNGNNKVLHSCFL